jgi:rare lipoprotein A
VVVEEIVLVGVRVCVIVLAISALMTEGCFAPQPAPKPPVGVFAGGGALTGVASWYGPGFNGHRTSSGSIYNQDDLSAASTLFPLGTRLAVTSLANGRSVQVVVNDHGPYVNGRDLDLSRRAALILGIIKPGTARVRMLVLNTPPGGPSFGPRYFVQVASFTDPISAQRVGEQLGRYYTDVHIIETRLELNRYYRVRMGMFSNRSEAEQRALNISRVGWHPILITE